MTSQKTKTESGKAPTPLSLSVAWGYGFAVMLFLFILTILVPDADGPSPWDADAFRKGLLEMIANFRILDEMADLSIVKVADVGEGYLIVDLDLIGVSERKFGWAPFYMSITFVALSLLLRAIRQRMLSSHFGIPSSVRGQLASYFYGRGLNLFFPFGPGELGAIQTLVENGADRPAAQSAIFFNRVFDLVSINLFLLFGFIYLGWGGSVEPFFWGLALLVGVVSLTRPMGRTAADRGPLENLWHAFGGSTLRLAVKELLETPKLFFGLLATSLIAFGLEVWGYWCIKQAFSSPMDDYILMKDLTFINFLVAVSIASLARVIPYTVASFGIYEFATVTMFRVFGMGFLGGTTVALLESLLMNIMTCLFFVLALWLAKCPSILETWRSFFAQSLARSESEGSTAS